jgi:putative addiction module killer protein
MNCFEQTPVFADWLMSLKDPVGKSRILARLRAAELGHFGDCETIGQGLWEMRIHCGPGYRVYFARRAKVIYLLLVAGDKSTQKRDIERARELAGNLC